MMQSTNLIFKLTAFASPLVQITLSLILAVWLIILWSRHREVFLLWLGIGIGILPLIGSLFFTITFQIVVPFFNINYGFLIAVLPQIAMIVFRLIEFICLVMAIIKLNDYLTRSSRQQPMS
ncbi:hypothetical protein GF373_11955 [bacterium]|nr:hypothetical protein [bacterium]